LPLANDRNFQSLFNLWFFFGSFEGTLERAGITGPRRCRPHGQHPGQQLQRVACDLVRSL